MEPQHHKYRQPAGHHSGALVPWTAPEPETVLAAGSLNVEASTERIHLQCMLILTSVATVSHCLYGENIHHCELRSHEAKKSSSQFQKYHL